MTGNVTRPYPETIEALEQRLEAKTRAYEMCATIRDQLLKENAEIRQANAEMVDLIRARDAEIEMLRKQRDLAEEAEEAAKRILNPEWAERVDRLTTTQADLPPTRAEEEEREG